MEEEEEMKRGGTRGGAKNYEDDELLAFVSVIF
jgi:hypothetical protein